MNPVIVEHAPVETTAREAVMNILRRHFGGDVVLDHYSSGAPFIAGFEGCVSISHSRHHVAVAIGCPRTAVGIDIEETDRYGQLHRVRSRFLSASELSRAGIDLLEAWTIKEAVYKAALTPGLALADIVLPEPSGNGLSVAAGHFFSVSVNRCDEFAMSVAVRI